jgi:hydroxyacylglutathione hydrolase
LLKDKDIIDFDFINFNIIASPGHTLDHIAYFHSSDKGSCLFCGDTLFSGGCSRLFEGTASA